MPLVPWKAGLNLVVVRPGTVNRANHPLLACWQPHTKPLPAVRGTSYFNIQVLTCTVKKYILGGIKGDEYEEKN